MYDLNKRSYFSTLGELRALLANLPDDTKVCTSGVYGSYIHFAKDDSLVSFDDEDLGEDYAEDCPIEDPDFWEGQEALMIKEHKMRLEELSHAGSNIDELSSQDRKILVWDKKDLDSFVSSFSNDELSEMYGYLYRHPYHPIDYDYHFDDYEDKYSLVYDYICHWLYDILNDGVFGDRTNARKLLDAAIAMG